MNFGSKERLIDVDISQPGAQALIHQCVLDRTCCFSQTLRELRSAHRERFGANVFLIGISAQPADFAEASRVAKSQFLAVAKLEDEMRMRRDLRIAGFDHQSARHAQMDEEAVAVVELKDNAFSTS